MTNKLSFKAFKDNALKDENFKVEYEALTKELEIISKFIKARKKANLSQQDLAKKLKTKQPSIARLEQGGYSSTSVAKLSKVADALGYNLKVSLQAKKKK